MNVLQSKKQCLFCGETQNLHRHHVYEGSMRARSEKYGLCVWLCPAHHTESDESVHFNEAVNRGLKRWAQKKAMKYYGWGKEEFIERIGRSYI